MNSIRSPKSHLIAREGWEKWKLAHAFLLISSGTTPPTSSVEYFQGEIPWVNTGDLNDGYIDNVSKNVSKKAVNDFSALKIYPKGSLIIALYGATIGKLGIITMDACTNQACCVLAKPLHLDSKFVFYWFISERSNIIELARGGGQPNISQEIVKQLRVLAPTIEQQKTIASFLDRKTAAIATLIAKKQHLIQLLEEKRTALINQAVTKGLNLNVPTKDSGIPWIGEVPKHWKAIQIRRYIRSIEQGWSPVAEDRIAQENEWAVLKLNSVNKGEFHPSEYKVLSENTKPDKRFEVKHGDLLLSRANTPQLVGEACYVSNPPPRLMLCDLLYRLDINECFLNKRFCTYYLLSKSGKAQISADARGTSQSMVKISQGHIKTWIIPLPPSLEEQESIANYLDAQLAFIRNVNNKIIQQINKLQEYRQSLITAAVTGKIDIREEVTA